MVSAVRTGPSISGEIVTPVTPGDGFGSGKFSY